MSRKTESDLGVLGGVIGIIIGALSFIVSGILSLVQLRFESGIVIGIVAVVLGFLAIFGAGVTRRDRLVGGIVMIVIAALGFELVGGFYIISSILVLVAGIIALVEHFR